MNDDNTPMPTVNFTANLRRHVECPSTNVAGVTVAEALDAVFVSNPVLRGYILEDDGSVRKHITIYVNNEPILDRVTLSDAVSEEGEIYVMQALSGG